MGMMQQMGGMSQMGGMIRQIRQFAGLIGNRNPEQMVRNYMRINGISDDQLRQVQMQAREIIDEMRKM